METLFKQCPISSNSSNVVHGLWNERERVKLKGAKANEWCSQMYAVLV